MIGGYSPEAFEKPLHDYQMFAADWILQRLYVRQWEGAGLFLDPGLGKTRTALSIMDVMFQMEYIKRALIVAPLRPVYGVWPGEIRRWGFPQSNVILHKQHVKAMSFDQQIELVNYEGLNRIADIAERWDLLVLDESTFIKNWSTNRTKFVRRMVEKIPRRLILTGTPAANSLGDLHAQLFVVDRGEALEKNVTRFRKKFCVQGGWRGRKWSVRDRCQDAILDRIKDKCLRMQAEDHLDMPDLVHNEIWCQMSESAYKQYKRLKRELFAELETGEVFAASAAAAYIKCRQFANGQIYNKTEDGETEVHTAHTEKVKALFELHEELAGKPLLVFYTFKHDLAKIQGAKDSPFKDSPVIAGGMKLADVDRILEEWNAGEHHAILCQWQAASHGLNMQGSCNDIACYGVIDSLETFEQAYRRVYRQGVTGNQVRVHKILMRRTVDEVMLERLQGKYETQAEFLAELKKHAKVR